MCNQFIQKIFPEYLVCAELWDTYSRRDQDYTASSLWYFRNMGTACGVPEIIEKMMNQGKGCNAQE